MKKLLFPFFSRFFSAIFELFPTLVKGTVPVILSDPPCKDGNACHFCRETRSENNRFFKIKNNDI